MKGSARWRIVLLVLATLVTVLGCGAIPLPLLSAGGTGSSGGSASITNLKNGSVVQTGLLLGTASAGASAVGVQLDGGAIATATGTTTWSYALPTGSQTWRQGSVHTIKVGVLSGGSFTGTTSTLTVTGGINHDINRDGYPDVVIGALGYNGSGANQGRVYVFHSQGTNGVATQSAATANSILTGEAGNARFGAFAASGDVNADGYADVIVGAWGAGKVYVFHSQGATGIASQGAAAANTILTGGAGNDYFGYGVAGGDVNGDGYLDVIVATFGYNSGGNQGRAYIFHSQGSAGIATQTAATADGILTGTSGSDQFACSVAAGDINGDGFADVVAGAQGYNGGGSQGRAYIFHSAGSGGVGNQAAASATTILTGTSGNDQFGGAVATGDFNGDGFTDVAVGAWNYNGGGGQGRAYIFHSQGTGGIASQAAAAATTILTGGAGQDRFCVNLATGDVNGDGFSDLIGGSYAYSAGGFTGRGYVFHSQGTSGIASQGVATADTVITGVSANDYLGFALAASDFNGDGYADVIIGSHAYNSGAFQGRAYLFHSQGSSGVATAGAAAANAILTGDAANDYFGIATF